MWRVFNCLNGNKIKYKDDSILDFMLKTPDSCTDLVHTAMLLVRLSKALRVKSLFSCNLILLSVQSSVSMGRNGAVWTTSINSKTEILWLTNFEGELNRLFALFPFSHNTDHNCVGYNFDGTLSRRG